MDGTSIVNLVLFESDIMKLHMCENCDFVVSVNMLTLFARAPFSWVALHTTECINT